MLGDIPGVGLLFSNRSQKLTTTGIVVLIMPKVIDFRDNVWNRERVEAAAHMERALQREEVRAKEEMHRVMDKDDLGSGGAGTAAHSGNALQDYRGLMSGI